MSDDATRTIETWFADHGDDGEFALQGREVPFYVIGSATRPGRIIFTTKTAVVARAIEECQECAEFGLIGRYGIPSATDASWMRDFAAEHALFFLGDLDPGDLLVFCWLRASLAPLVIKHLGVSDAYLSELTVQLPETFVMQLSQAERESLPLLAKVFPDYREIVGPRAAEILDQGCKIELEAVVSALGTAEPILRPALRENFGQ